MERAEKEMSKLEKQPATKLDVARFVDSLLQFRQEVVGNYDVILSKIKETVKEDENKFDSINKRMEGEILPQLSKLLEVQGDDREKLGELRHLVSADMKEKERIINELTAKVKGLSNRLIVFLVLLIISYIIAIASLLGVV
jgi:hypothetical protein